MRGNERIAATCDAIAERARPLADTLRQVEDANLPAIGVWNIGETAHHVAGSPAYFLGAVRGDVALERLEHLEETHARQLADDRERDPRVLADRFELSVTELVSHARTLSGDPQVEPFAGVKVPFSTVLGIQLAEELVHGFDIARAAGLPWRIDPAHALLAVDGLLPMLPFVVDEQRAKGKRVSFELRIRSGPRYMISLADGSLRVAGASKVPVDYRLSVDPVGYLLLTFNRLSPLRLIAQGKLLAWGRRPWAAATFQSMLQTV